MIRELYSSPFAPNSFSVNFDFKDFDLIPFFYIKTRSSVPLVINSSNLFGILPEQLNQYNPTSALGSIFDKYSIYTSNFEYNFRRLLNLDKKDLQNTITLHGTSAIKKLVETAHSRNRFVENLNTLINSINEIYINENLINLRASSFSHCGNNVPIITKFNHNSTGYFQRNDENLIIYNQNVFKKTEQGEYPVLLSGIRKNSLLNFKQQIFNKLTSQSFSFSNVIIYIDYDWFLESTNKILKNILIKSLTETYKDAEIILFNGKEFASKNMFSYQIPSFSTLAKKKNFISILEKDLNAKLIEEYGKFDYKAEIESFTNLYNQFTKEQSEEPKPKPVEAVVVEEAVLSAEDMRMIQELMGETGSEPESDIEDVEFEEDEASSPQPIAVNGITGGFVTTSSTGLGILDQIRTMPPSTPYHTIITERLIQAIEEITRNGGT